jgi:hypothetical protein
MPKGVLLAASALIALGACQKRQPDVAPMNKEEAQGLEDARNMLDASPDSLAAGNDVELGNGEEAEDDPDSGAPANAAAPAPPKRE